MDEKRKFFRIINKGEIRAQAADDILKVIDISSSGILVIKKNINIPKEGILEIHINSFSMYLHYQVLRVEKETMALIFRNEEEINNLFVILHKLKNERKPTPKL